MAKKIYDVKPPKVVKKVEKELKEFLNEGKKPRTQTARHSRHKKTERPLWVPISVGVLAIVVIVGVYLFFKLPKADIFIWPKVDELSFQKTITADKSVDTVDILKNVIPAQYFEATKTNTQEFPATGNASNEGLASGAITVYNKVEPVTPITFKAGTHFMSDSGKLFVTFQKVVIPAAKKSGSKVTPGSVKINVQAVEGGNDYNIAPSNFSVPGLKGTSYYYSIYATSADAMTGGYAGKVKKVTNDDIQGAKDVLVEKTTSDATSDLKNQISSEYILLDNAILSKVSNTSTQTKVGAVVDNFNYQTTVTTSAVAFKKSDIDKFAKDYIISQLPDGKTFLESNFKVDYAVSTVDISGGKATVNLDFSSGAYQSINKNSLELSLLSKTADQIKEVVTSRLGEQVTKIETKFWPFWVSAAPNNQKAVIVELKF